MFTKKDQVKLADVYGQIQESFELSPVSKPVIVTMDMPGAEVSQGDVQPQDHEHDSSEIEMAAAELHKITEYAPKLSQIISSMPSLEGWVASKITKAADYISSVYHWLEYQSHSGKSSCTQDSDMFNSGYNETGCSYAKQGCTCGQCSDCN